MACLPAVTFASASAVHPDGAAGTFAARLSPRWAVGDKPHGGYLMAVMARAGLAALGEGLEPLAVSAQFLRAPEPGPVRLETEVRKRGRTASVVAVRLLQGDQDCVSAMVTAGTLPAEPPVWSALPQQPGEPPERTIAFDRNVSKGVFRIGEMCELRIDPDTAGHLRGSTDLPPRMRLWARPVGEQPDPVFALVAGDLNPPVVFNLGRVGWSPTVQLTALLRARPAPGWLRIEAACTAVHGAWFDSDATVVDSRGRLVCQARQLALSAAR